MSLFADDIITYIRNPMDSNNNKKSPGTSE